MESLRAAGHQDVLKWKWTGEELLSQLIATDHEHVPEMDEVDEGTAPQWSPVFMQNPRTWSLLVDESRLPSVEAVAGYWSFCMLRPEVYDLALRGMLNDSEITPASIRPINGPGEYDAYIVMFVVAEAYRKPGVIMLVRSFFENLQLLADEGVFVRRLCANAFTPAGARLCQKMLGLESQARHFKRGEVFARRMLPATADVFPATFRALNGSYRSHRLAEPQALRLQAAA